MAIDFKTYPIDQLHSFSGADITPYIIFYKKIGNKYCSEVIKLENLLQISVSIHSDIGQVRQLGTKKISGIVDGPMTIAGSIVFNLENESPLIKLMKSYKSFLSRLFKGDDRLSKIPAFEQPMATNLPPFDIVLFLSNEYAAGIQTTLTTYRELDESDSADEPEATDIFGFNISRKKSLADNRERPVNKTYYRTFCQIRGIRLPDAAYNFSVDNVTTDYAIQFVASDFTEPITVKSLKIGEHGEKAYDLQETSPYYLPAYTGDLETILTVLDQEWHY